MQAVISFATRYFCETVFLTLVIIKTNNQSWPVWLSWLERCPVNQTVDGSIPSQDTCLSCGFIPQLGCIQVAAYECFSLTSTFLSLSLSLLSLLSRINKHVLGWGLKKEEKLSKWTACLLWHAYPLVVLKCGFYYYLGMAKTMDEETIAIDKIFGYCIHLLRLL